MRRLSIYRCFWFPVILCILLLAGTALADPVCEISRIDEGPPFRVTFSVQEGTLGIQSVTVVEAINASVSYQPFPPGFISAIEVVATKVDQNGPFKVAIRATDMRGQLALCGYEQEEPVEEFAPSCFISGIDSGPPFGLEFTIQDEDDGLQYVSVTDSDNAEITIPSFSPGITEPVVVSVVKQNESLGVLVVLEAVDMGGRITVCRYEEGSSDLQPPAFTILFENPGPPFGVGLGVRDTGSGLRSITALNMTNATVFIPDFTQGTQEVVVIEILQSIGNLGFSVLLEARDMSNNVIAFEYPAESFLEVRPEFDAVGNDSSIFFKDYCKDMIIVKGQDRFGRAINDFSDFPSEGFANTAAGLTPDPCFSSSGNTYLSSLASTWTQATYEWRIALQMKPASDVSLHVVGCVLTAGETDGWKQARQTGLYRTPWAPRTPVFSPQANPRIQVRALPGPFSVTGFPQEGFYLDARKSPGLDSSSLLAGYLTLQSMVEGNVLLALPRTGATNALGQTTFELSRGDVLQISIVTPYNNTADVRFGADNVHVKYLGFVGTEFTILD